MKKTPAQVFKAARIRLNLTQKEVADKAGLFPNTYARIERGDQKPKFETIQDIAKALGISLSDL